MKDQSTVQLCGQVMEYWENHLGSEAVDQWLELSTKYTMDVIVDFWREAAESLPDLAEKVLLSGFRFSDLSDSEAERWCERGYLLELLAKGGEGADS